MFLTWIQKVVVSQEQYLTLTSVSEWFKVEITWEKGSDFWTMNNWKRKGKSLILLYVWLKIIKNRNIRSKFTDCVCVWVCHLGVGKSSITFSLCCDTLMGERKGQQKDPNRRAAHTLSLLLFLFQSPAPLPRFFSSKIPFLKCAPQSSIPTLLSAYLKVYRWTESEGKVIKGTQR